MSDKLQNGYPYIYIPKSPEKKGHTITEHILIMEAILGRKLFRDEVVHHIDENRSNNDPENLIVFKTKGDHNRYHKLKKYGKSPVLKQIETNIYICLKQKSKNEESQCRICGKLTQINKTGLCRTCFLNDNSRLTIKNLPSYKELLKMLENGDSCLTLAKKYGTSYQTIRSRIRKKI